MNYVLLLGLLLMLGLLSSRVTKKIKLPFVTGYLVVGLIGAVICILIDYCSNGNTDLANQLTLLNDSLSSVALGFIALSIGEEFRLGKIKKYGGKIFLITFLQAFSATVLVDAVLVVACICLSVPLEIAICLGAIATATAPAATLMVIHQYNAKGPLVDLLLPVVAFDDAVGLVVFAISVAISKVISTSGEISFISVCVLPLVEVIGSLLIGFVLGFILHCFIKFFKGKNTHVINFITFTLLGVGLCQLLNENIVINNQHMEFSNLLCCMMIGATYENLASRNQLEMVEKDFALVERWTPFLFMLFFVLSGAHLVTSTKSILENDINFLNVAIVFALYIIFRSLGKYLGAFLGCKITKQNKTTTNYLGITLLPQAGVAIGMANQISQIGEFKLSGSGDIIVTVVLCATLVYELVGPLLTKWSLTKAGEISKENNN